MAYMLSKSLDLLRLKLHFQVFKEPKVDQETVTRLIPSLIGLGVNEHVVALSNKLKTFHQEGEDGSSQSESVVEVKGEKEKPPKKKAKIKKVRQLVLLW